MVRRFGPIPADATPNTARLDYAGSGADRARLSRAGAGAGDPVVLRPGCHRRTGSACCPTPTAAAQAGADRAFGTLLDWWRASPDGAAGEHPGDVRPQPDHRPRRARPGGAAARPRRTSWCPATSPACSSTRRRRSARPHWWSGWRGSPGAGWCSPRAGVAGSFDLAEVGAGHARAADVVFTLAADRETDRSGRQLPVRRLDRGRAAASTAACNAASCRPCWPPPARPSPPGGAPPCPAGCPTSRRPCCTCWACPAAAQAAPWSGGCWPKAWLKAWLKAGPHRRRRSRQRVLESRIGPHRQVLQQWACATGVPDHRSRLVGRAMRLAQAAQISIRIAVGRARRCGLSRSGTDPTPAAALPAARRSFYHHGEPWNPAMPGASSLDDASAGLLLRLRQQELAAGFARFGLETDELEPVLDEACRVAARGHGLQHGEGARISAGREPVRGARRDSAGLTGTVGVARLGRGSGEPGRLCVPDRPTGASPTIWGGRRGSARRGCW